MTELQVGQKRDFSFDQKIYEIKEILLEPKITMWWEWNTGICPHCKRKLTRNILHDFYRIEILTDEKKLDADVTIDDIVALGDTKDNRKMLLSRDKLKEVFEKSKNFKKFASEV